MKLLTHRLNKLVSKRLVQGRGGGEGWKRGRRVEGRKRKVKVETAENYLEILLSVHARTSEVIFWIIETEDHEVLHV